MLTQLTIRNFKRFDEVEIELGNTVVFIGPNNSGKTTALQALALWDIGLRRWNEKRAGKAAPEKRPGVTINRRDLIALPIPDANLLWRDLSCPRRAAGRQGTEDKEHSHRHCSGGRDESTAVGGADWNSTTPTTSLSTVGRCVCRRPVPRSGCDSGRSG